jgi:hypothetical protein
MATPMPRAASTATPKGTNAKAVVVVVVVAVVAPVIVAALVTRERRRGGVRYRVS